MASVLYFAPCWANIPRSNTLDPAVFKQRTLTTPVAEVHEFICAKMDDIRVCAQNEATTQEEKQDWDNWPTPDQQLKLSEKADGLFHYAATALEYIEAQIGIYKRSCQTRVFEEFTQMGIQKLEDLYKLILISFEKIEHPPQDDKLWRQHET
ncbi:hypothetical protein B0H13DRAFT_1883598 [Mycena leptocephala]|nr:hypothetical protein B0H13DRAFT_1883598 [Mycena leptocephala]